MNMQKGALEFTHLAEILEEYSNSGKTGQFILSREKGSRGFIVMEKGEIVHAEIDKFSGEDAFFTITLKEEGTLTFEPGSWNGTRTIARPIAPLLLEAAKRVDEWKVLATKIGSVDAIPQFSEISRTENRKISLSTMEWLIVSKIDGKNTIAQISEKSSINIFDTARTLYGMVTSGLIRLHPSA
ncbi:MAG: DUF4388 domain-containing protein [Candidatus Omnitrophota bacterium]